MDFRQHADGSFSNRGLRHSIANCIELLVDTAFTQL